MVSPTSTVSPTLSVRHAASFASGTFRRATPVVSSASGIGAMLCPSAGDPPISSASPTASLYIANSPQGRRTVQMLPSIDYEKKMQLADGTATARLARRTRCSEALSFVNGGAIGTRLADPFPWRIGIVSSSQKQKKNYPLLPNFRLSHPSLKPLQP